MRRCLAFLATVLLSAWAGTAVAANSVTVESRQVPLGATGVTVGVYLENEDSLSGLVIPLEIREVTSGAFIADTLEVSAQNRLVTSLSDMVVQDFMPEQDNTKWWCCDGGGFSTRGAPDFLSPDAFIYAAIATSGPSLPIGNDGSPPDGNPSIQIMFAVTETEGTFEIDTVCITPNNHLTFMGRDEVAPLPVSFTKGIVTIVDSCACDCHADPICDSVHNILDLVAIVGVAFQGADPIPDPNPFCPYETTDVNCDDVTNVLDVGLMNLVVNYGANPDSTFCNPCAP
ncbi:MAG TPA: hypothetical protein VM118_10130 [Acidobacteriota bacterium]|nr:hypothetical protein [Acidobacteriota bacterium]